MESVKIQSFDARRNIIIPGNKEKTLQFSTEHFIFTGKEAILKRGRYLVALCGGTTPKGIFHLLSQPKWKDQLDWSKVWVFWSDERNVPQDHPNSNYFSAMQSGLSSLPISSSHIFPIPTQRDPESNALSYQKIIEEKVPSATFDLMMLGMGEDGHTASLFPRTHGLDTRNRLVVANYVPIKHEWRITMTYECIHLARAIVIYVIGANKGKKVEQCLLGPYLPADLPVQKVGLPMNKALWICDQDAAQPIMDRLCH